MSGYEAVVFDMDGVLVEGWGTHPAVYREAADQALSELGAEAVDGQLKTLGETAYSETTAGACRDLGVDPEAFWERREHHASRLANDRLDRGERSLYDDVNTLTTLAESLPLGVVSNNRHETVRFVVESLLPAPISAYRGRDPTVEGYRRRKPDTHYLNAVLRELDAEDALYVGDRETDVEVAAGAGIDSAFVRRTHNTDSTLARSPTHEIEGLDALVDVIDST
ncbi:HAD family hydrolase [Natronorarus salvus]|uniref:HAD family hydrolase n=1 Tax=Natronorarus salvus TaxID=3117733 RepID=UPI002F26045D